MFFFLLYNHLLAEKNILKIFGKIQSVQFPTANNISKNHENRRQKSASGVAGIQYICIIDTVYEGSGRIHGLFAASGPKRSGSESARTDMNDKKFVATTVRFSQWSTALKISFKFEWYKSYLPGSTGTKVILHDHMLLKLSSRLTL